MTEETKREQTLLEAAKALVATLEWSSSQATANLRAAIAREEAKPADYWYTRVFQWRDVAEKAKDRAQQAEAEAKWHREESARLSAELAKERETLDPYRTRFDKIRAVLQAAPNEHVVRAAERVMLELAKITGISNHWMESSSRWQARAEEAEANLASYCGPLPAFKVDPKACALPTQTYTFILERVPTGFMPFAQASVDALSLLLKALGGKS